MIEDYINNEYCDPFVEKRSKKMKTKIIKSVVSDWPKALIFLIDSTSEMW